MIYHNIIIIKIVSNKLHITIANKISEFILLIFIKYLYYLLIIYERIID